jgi:hypothetical protein
MALKLRIVNSDNALKDMELECQNGKVYPYSGFLHHVRVHVNAQQMILLVIQTIGEYVSCCNQFDPQIQCVPRTKEFALFGSVCKCSTLIPGGQTAKPPLVLW